MHYFHFTENSGRQIDYKQNWKGRNYDSYIFAAPVTVGTKTEYVAAVVIQDNESSRFYLHEAVDENGNIVVIKNDNVSEAFKTRSDGRTRVTGASGTLPGASVTGNNSNVKEKFSMDEPVEETGTLIALHNMSSEKIGQTLELGAWHNGKVERSHRSDQEQFYNYPRFYSYEDLQVQMKRYLRRSNRIPMSVLGWKTPIQKREELEAARFC